MASIRKREWTTRSGKAKTAWILDYFDQDGTRRQKTFKYERDAKKAQTAILGEVAAGTHTPDSESVTISEAAEIWLKACEAGRNGRPPAEASTMRAYRNHAHKHIVPRIGHVKLNRLTAPMIGKFRDGLLAGTDDHPALSRHMAGKSLLP